MTFYEIITCISYVVKGILKLSAFLIGICVLINRPTEHGSGISHGKVELYMVSRIIPSAGKVNFVISPVIKAGISAPVCPRIVRKRSRALELVKKKGFLQSFTVIEITGALGSFVTIAFYA